MNILLTKNDRAQFERVAMGDTLCYAHNAQRLVDQGLLIGHGVVAHHMFGTARIYTCAPGAITSVLAECYLQDDLFFMFIDMLPSDFKNAANKAIEYATSQGLNKKAARLFALEWLNTMRAKIQAAGRLN